jgi:hypothetical protein
MSSTPIKKRVIKKVITPVQPADVEPVQVPAENGAASGITIPSSRVCNYISGVKLNKTLDDQVKAVKGGAAYADVLSAADVEDVNAKLLSGESSNAPISGKIASIEGGQELSTLLTEDEQKRVGDSLKKKEDKNAKLPEAERQPIVLKDVAVEVLKRDLVTPASAVVEVLSKHRAKFSKNSFEVLAAFGDIIVEEIARFTMGDMVAKSKTGRGIIEIKNVHSEEIKKGDLYSYYSNLPSFLKSLEDYNTAVRNKSSKQSPADAGLELAEAEPAGDDVDEDDSAEYAPGDDGDHKINFKFYVKSICNKLKAKEEAFKDLKISENFQTLCSNVVIDMLDGVTKVSQIVLGVMSTKTLTQSLFRTCVHILIRDTANLDKTLQDLDSRV